MTARRNTRIAAMLFLSALALLGMPAAAAANENAKGAKLERCYKNGKARLNRFRKNGWALFHTVRKKDAVLRVFRKGLTFRMAKQYKADGRLCVYRR